MDHRKLLLGVCFAVFAVIYCGAGILVKENAVSAVEQMDEPVTVIIDAGHGGEDGGAVSFTGAKESDLNLSIAQRTEQILSLCGVRTGMIRTQDTAVYTEGKSITEKKVSDLKNRVQAVNRVNPAMLLSIHQNHFSESQYHGAQVFYAPTDDSKELAENMQNQLRNTLDPTNKRAIKRASAVYLMENIMCPGILIECGFLSNPQEDLLLQNPVYQTKLACVISSVVTMFLEEGINREV